MDKYETVDLKAKHLKLEDFKKVLESDVLKNISCIEMSFHIEDDLEYEDCWVGKMPDKDDTNKEIYWYELVEDGSQSYDYNNLEDILNGKVFNGKSICDIWDKVSWYSLDGCRIEERLPYYIDDNKQQPLRSAPRSFK